MKLTVLVDNNTFIDKYYYGEPAVSYYIEDGDKKILFDAGYSDIFIRNAEKMGLNLRALDYIVISHGHSDHIWGIEHLTGYYNDKSGANQSVKPILLAHPSAFCPKNFGYENIGTKMPITDLEGRFNVKLEAEPFWISDKMVFLGHVERTNTFENKEPIGKTVVEGIEKDDYLEDDTALAYKSEKGLVIITGCSHSGICNIIEHAKKVCKEERVAGIIGGFHLLNPPVEQLENTVNYIKSIHPKEIFTGHCTDLQSKLSLSKVADMKEVGVGLEIEYK